MGFSVKLMPGVRLRLSSRGLRTSIGPRIARVHLGGGRLGVSSGIGPFGASTSIGGRRGGRRTAASARASYQRQLAAQRRQAVQAEKEALARELADAFLRILALHRVDFPPAQRPVAPEPAAPDRDAVYAHFERHALTGVGLFSRAERAAARQTAAGWAAAEVERQWQRLRAERAGWQQQLDRYWHALCANDPGTVLQALADAFEDNEATAAPVGVDGSEVSLVLVVPPAAEAIPEQMPAQTAAGNLTLKKITQTAQANYYTQFACGQVLVTLRETFAAAPGLAAARVVVLRNDGRDVYGRPSMPCLAAFTVERTALHGVRWADAGSVEILDMVARESLVKQAGRTRDLAPVDLRAEPQIAALVRIVDLEDLAAGR
ncbi:DUF4236 domain-containing protein [Dactylosporangium sp. McL0621]|uniref:DUF4236 domain-containing protein n=1 Tax=Dactylosporangium sp. McL0621 TaxID=3415678 RepID=UPI003CF4DB7C